MMIGLLGLILNGSLVRTGTDNSDDAANKKFWINAASTMAMFAGNGVSRCLEHKDRVYTSVGAICALAGIGVNLLSWPYAPSISTFLLALPLAFRAVPLACKKCLKPLFGAIRACHRLAAVLSNTRPDEDPGARGGQADVVGLEEGVAPAPPSANKRVPPNARASFAPACF